MRNAAAFVCLLRSDASVELLLWLRRGLRRRGRSPTDFSTKARGKHELLVYGYLHPGSWLRHGGEEKESDTGGRASLGAPGDP